MDNVSENITDLNIKFDSDVYSLQAIKNAAYDYSGNVWISIKISNKKVLVSVKPKESSFIADSFRFDFINHVLDHQVRIDTGKEFKVIREMIVAQAFEPCENLNLITEKLIDDQQE